MKTSKFIDARLNYARQSLDLFRRIIRRTECITNLLIAQLRQNISQPLCLSNSDVLYQVLVLALIIKANQAMLDSGNELRVGDVLIRAIARMANEPAFLAKARAEIGVK